MFNNLFNQNLMKKYLKRNGKKFSLTHSKKEILLKWITKLENNELTEEIANYGLFSRLILEKILEYNYEQDIKENVKEEYGKGFSEFTLQQDNEPFMIIELKGQNISLDQPQNRAHDKRTPIDQAFDYSKHSGEINWILVSNYQEFRLYNWHTKKHQHIHFNIKELLQPAIFQQFMLTFSKHSIENNLIEKLLTKTQFIEKNFETEFYKLYHETRLMLINELEHQHPLFTRNKSIHYAQLILNRYIFICFAEDLGLLPEQITFQSIHNPIQNHDLGRGEIWHRLNQLFLDINEGNEFKKIYGYNGGLFSEKIEHLKIRDIIDDHTLFKDTYTKWKFEEHSSLVEEKLNIYIGKINPIYKNLLTISTFDFSSELDVNILGHIFENSIGDIEELQKSNRGRRKKEGIYYTPDHITDYICRNTILPYLSKTGTPHTIDGLINEYYGETELLELDEKVKNIKILDPACGSGAFLNKSSDILLELHEKIHKKLYPKNTLDKHFDPIDERRKILLQNIHGVDLNEESVEITKLSLFLKVCKEGLKLPNLNNNIQQGNSLIDNPEYTNKAFVWEEKFKEIFNNGGFDIIIGNPPYINVSNLDSNERTYFIQKYNSAIKRFDIYVLFLEIGEILLKNGGKLGYIIPYPFLSQKYAEKIRIILLNNYKINQIVDMSKFKVFFDAVVRNIILISEKELNKINRDQNNCIAITQNKDPNLSGIIGPMTNIRQLSFFNTPENMFRLDLNEINSPIIEKIDSKFKIGKIILASWGARGVPVNEFHLNEKKDSFCKKMVKGANIERYSLNYTGKWLLYDIEKLYRPSFSKLFESEKLIIKKVTGKTGLISTYDNSNIYTDDSLCCCILKYNLKDEDPKILKKHKLNLDDQEIELSKKYNLKYILTLINSKLLNFYFKIMLGYDLNVYPENIEELPLYPANLTEQKPFIEKADKMLQLNKDLNNEVNGFKDWLQRTYHITKFSMKLEKYYELTFQNFLTELKKKKVDISSRKVQELLQKEYTQSIQKIQPLLLEIQETDQEIDQMIYKLYNLTPEEIQLIEGKYVN